MRTTPGRAAAGCIAAALLATGCTGATGLPYRELPEPRAEPVAAHLPTQPAPEQAADPVRVRVPAIGVDAGVVALEVDPQGVLPPPATDHEAGWWRAGPEPGEIGPAVVVGHVDSRRGPAVFFRLRQLVPGDQVLVDRADGSTVVFVVERIERFGKDAFPTEAVYGTTPDARLRLVTCGGRFDRSTRHYVDNVVVFARAA